MRVALIWRYTHRTPPRDVHKNLLNDCSEKSADTPNDHAYLQQASGDGSMLAEPVEACDQMSLN